MLLQDELFKGQDEYIVDECLTFMAAATQTTTILISNAIYYLTKCKDKCGILRSELCSALNTDLQQLQAYTDKEWITQLLENEAIQKCNYLSYCITETLRLDPSVRGSSLMEF
jgi:cytochrome P450